MACYIFGAGSFYGLDRCPRAGDFIIAADGGWLACRKTGITPDLLLGDFDSLSTQPDFPNIPGAGGEGRHRHHAGGENRAGAR